MFGRLLGKPVAVPNGPAPAAAPAAASAPAVVFGDRRNKRAALFGARPPLPKAASAPAAPSRPQPAPAQAAETASATAATQAPAQDAQTNAPRAATAAAQAAAELGAAEALYAIAPHLRGQPPHEIFRAYQEARRTGGRTWSEMMQDLGITDESPQDAKRKAAQDARDHPRYADYMNARTLRDAAVLAIAADQKTYAGLIGQNPNAKIGFEADLRVALGQGGVRQAEQKARAALAERYGTAGRPQPAAPDDDPTRLKPRFGRVADVRPIQDGKGVVGTIVQDYGKGPFDFVAFGRPSDFLKRLKDQKVKVLGNADERAPSRFRIYFAFPLEKEPRGGDVR